MADLLGVIEAEGGGFGAKAEGAANGDAQFGPVEFPGSEIFGSDGEAVAAARTAGADGEDASIGLGDDFVGAAAAQRARDEFYRVARIGLQKGSFEGRVKLAEFLFPGQPSGIEGRDGFEGDPDVAHG